MHETVLLSPPSSLSALRRLLDERFPTAARAAGVALATGVPAVDAAFGGLPRPGLTEIACTAPSCGSQLLWGQLLHVTREAGLRVALVDAHDAFDPGSWPATVLEHLVWVRARNALEAMAAADLLVRDANLGLVALDLRHAATAELRQIPSTQWYRLQRALEPAGLAGVVFTPRPSVPSAQFRLELSRSHGLAAQSAARPQLTGELAPALLRQRTHASSCRAGSPHPASVAGSATPPYSDELAGLAATG